MSAYFTLFVVVILVAATSGEEIGPCLIVDEVPTCPRGVCINGLCVVQTPVPPTTPCNDLGSDCPKNANLCTNTVYFQLMSQQCPKTCNRCSTNNGGGGSTCVDKTNANGVSECAQNARLCNDAVYRNLMTQQCPRTCGRCPSG